MIELKKDVVQKEVVPAGRYFTVDEYAKFKSINKSTLRTLISRGKITSFLLDGKRLIPANFEPVSQKN